LIGKEEQNELPAVLDAATAKSLVQQMIARLWADRDKVTLRLPPAYLALEPGTTLELPISPRLWVVETAMIESFVAVLQLRPARTAIGMLAADPGRIVANPDVVPQEIVLALLDTPTALSSGNGPSLTLAASTATAGWRHWAVESKPASFEQRLASPSWAGPLRRCRRTRPKKRQSSSSWSTRANG
jgi:hypothetical protein